MIIRSERSNAMNGMGKLLSRTQRSKRIAKELIDCHSTAEDLEGERW